MLRGRAPGNMLLVAGNMLPVSRQHVSLCIQQHTGNKLPTILLRQHGVDAALRVHYWRNRDSVEPMRRRIPLQTAADPIWMDSRAQIPDTPTRPHPWPALRLGARESALSFLGGFVRRGSCTINLHRRSGLRADGTPGARWLTAGKAARRRRGRYKRASLFRGVGVVTTS